MDTNFQESFIQLVRLGIGISEDFSIPKAFDWDTIKALAEKQGLDSIVLDGVEKLPEQQRPPKVFLLQWIGEVLQQERNYMAQHKAAQEAALIFHSNYIRTYVLKGAVIAECYPKPAHRHSVDMDCYLLPEKGDFDAWALGNDLMKSNGYEVVYDFYKNSTFILPGLTVENHRFFTPFRGNKRLGKLESWLQGMMRDDKGEDRFEGAWLYRPPVMVSALFLIEHAYSHFLHEGLTWRLVLDWMMFLRRHYSEIDWPSLDASIDEFGFRKFYDTYNRLGQYIIGEFLDEPSGKAERSVDRLEYRDSLMLEDIWAPLDLHETVKGWRGKWALVGNTWRARWKYHYFSDISMLHALWIQVKGFLFIKEPKLS